jgi:hypothetical protein
LWELIETAIEKLMITAIVPVLQRVDRGGLRSEKWSVEESEAMLLITERGIRMKASFV